MITVQSMLQHTSMPSSIDAATVQVVAAEADNKHAVLVQEAPNVSQPDRVCENQSASQQNDEKRQIQHAVTEYVRALLDPFYKAGIVDKEVSISQWLWVVLYCINSRHLQTRGNKVMTIIAAACEPIKSC